MPRVTKEQAESAIFDRFQSAYKRRFGYSLQDIEHQDMPDFIALDPFLEERLGIEVTGVYQDPTEAKIQYWDIESWGKFTGSIDELISSINSRLDDKAEKSREYNFDGRLVLAIWIGSLIYNQVFDIDFIRHDIVVPDNEFSNIWLILKSQSDDSPELYDLQ